MVVRLPETKAAWRAWFPMVISTCGVPVTVIASSKYTVTVRTSSAMKVPFAPCAVPESRRPVTLGATASEAAPFTRKSPSLLTACVPRPSAASLPAASRIVPPFAASAVAAMLSPLASVSPLCTV